jgi:hypothetical protein
MSEMGGRRSGTNSHSPLLRPFFFVAGVAYEGLVRSRNALYDASLVPQRTLPRPVISVATSPWAAAGRLRWLFISHGPFPEAGRLRSC